MTLPHDTTNLQARVTAEVRAHWKAFLIEGILLAILGLAAMIVPPLASLAVTIFLGWLFLISDLPKHADILGKPVTQRPRLLAGQLLDGRGGLCKNELAEHLVQPGQQIRDQWRKTSS